MYNVMVCHFTLQDVSYSNWLTYIIACDSRGLVQGIPCLDLAYNEADTKTYSQRLVSGILFVIYIIVIPGFVFGCMKR